MFVLEFYQNTQPARQALVLGDGDVLFSCSGHHSKHCASYKQASFTLLRRGPHAPCRS